MLRVVLYLLLGLLALPYVLTPLYAVVDPPSTLMLWRNLTGQRVERQVVKLDRIAPALALSVLIAEDGRFCEHYGVDFKGIQAAMADAENMEDVRGGSTISQQVAKNLFLWGGRSYVRKALEFPLALWIDLVLSKRRVLEIYLNIAEWGPDGEFGAEAGARRAFNRSARDLSPYQAAMLAAMLPNPVARDARKPGPGLRRLAGLYSGRATRSPEVAACLRQNR
jgi:monofunctional biosynthetic peptidoglycan transglycosylase